MELMLEVVSRQKFTMGSAATYIFSEAGGYVGRENECEWALPDKTKHISRKHALVSCDGKAFYFEDVSTNGIRTVLGKESLPKKTRVKIEHGASFYFGEYTVQARVLHNPDSYLPPVGSSEPTELIPDDAFLDLDPLVAMEQQEEFEAKKRLGIYTDLLGTAEAKTTFQSDHSTPSIDSMLSISAIPENWGGGERSAPASEALPEQPQQVTPSAPHIVESPAQSLSHLSEEPQREVITHRENDVFFEALGFNPVPELPEERERILKQAADLLLASVDGMLQSLRNRADSKNDLRLPVTTMTLAGNNPLKFSPTAQAALAYLLGAQQDGMLPAGQAMLNGFGDLHSHHMGLLAGARAAVQAALSKIAPEKVEGRLDADGSARFNRTNKLWNTYGRMHRQLLDDPESFSAFFLQDFARAYELQVRTLHPTPNRLRGE